MAYITGHKNSNNGFRKSQGSLIESSNKNQRFFLISLGCLIAAILFLSLNLRLVSGIFIIASASSMLLAYRKTSESCSKFIDSVNEMKSICEEQNDLITNFSHKIREPLNNVVIISEILIGSGLEKKQKELFETFIASTNNMVTTVNELSMHSAGNITPEIHKAIHFNLVSTIESTFELFSLKEKANLEFILNTKDLNETEFIGDPITLKQIFLDLFNKIENEATEKAITITIDLRKLKETKTESTISFRVQTDKKIVIIEDTESSLNLAPRLISSVRGSYDQEIGTNHTILNVYIPLTDISKQTTGEPVSSKLEELFLRDKVKKELKDLKVLLVEDNLINQKITQLTLSPYVGSIDTASNGKEAMDKFGTSNYDLILMDIQMPVMSGLTAAEKIRALESTTKTHVPIIAITANAMIGDKEKCLAVGIDDYISKPFQPSALVEKIKKVI